MTVFVDKTRAVRITLREWDDENPGYGPDWSNDFYEAGSPLWESIPSCESLAEADTPAYVEEHGLVVDDVDYPLEQAYDMVSGVGDFAEAGPQPGLRVFVETLDRDLYPAF